MSSIAWVGVGANLGEAIATVRTVIEQLNAIPRTRVEAASRLWRTRPVDAEGPDFINAVARIETLLAPESLLLGLQGLEAIHHRERPYRNAPRTLDLDLLLMQDLRGKAIVRNTPDLCVPHPRLHKRAFVLLPLADLNPDLEIQGHGALADLIRETSDQILYPLEA